MDRRGFVPIVILLIIAGVLILGGVLYYETQKSPSVPSVVVYTQTPINPSTNTQPINNQSTTTPPVSATATNIQFSGLDLEAATKDNQLSQFEATIQSMEMNCCLVLQDNNGKTAIALTPSETVSNLNLMPGDKISFGGTYLGSLGSDNGNAILDPSTYPSQVMKNLPSETPILITDHTTYKVVSQAPTAHAGTWTEVSHDNGIAKSTDTGPYIDRKYPPPFQITSQRWRVQWTMTNHVVSDTWPTTAKENTQDLDFVRVASLRDISNPVPFGTFVHNIPVADGQTVSGTVNEFGPGTYLITVSSGVFSDVTWNYKVEQLKL